MAVELAKSAGTVSSPAKLADGTAAKGEKPP
jgi:hypothetical protein